VGTEPNARTNVLDLFRLDGKTAVITGGAGALDNTWLRPSPTSGRT